LINSPGTGRRWIFNLFVKTVGSDGFGWLLGEDVMWTVGRVVGPDGSQVPLAEHEYSVGVLSL
jgi:hypothetical protein